MTPHKHLTAICEALPGWATRLSFIAFGLLVVVCPIWVMR